jgi:hypothetical protein
VRLPTFTIEEYYEEEDDEEEDDAGPPTAPIYNKRELLRELRGVRLARSNNIVGGTLSLPDQALYNRRSLRAEGDLQLEQLDGELGNTVWFSYSAAGQRWSPREGFPKMQISTVVIQEPQCPVEELRVTPIDEVSHKRYQRALERLWREHTPYKDPVLHSFQQVPFPHCNVGDLQVMAMDVLHKKRTHKAQRLDRYDPALRVVGCVVLQTPVCDLASLRERPLDEVVERRFCSKSSSVTQPASHEPSLTSASSSRSSWADSLLRRRAETGSLDEVWTAEDDDAFADQDTNDVFLHSHEALKTTEAIVSSALRTDRINLFHPFDVSRSATGQRWGEPEEIDDDPTDAAAISSAPLRHAVSDSNPSPVRHELDATGEKLFGKSTNSQGSEFEFAVIEASSNARASRKRRKSQTDEKTDDKLQDAHLAFGTATITGLATMSKSASAGVVNEIKHHESMGLLHAEHSDIDEEDFNDETSAFLDQACFEVHLDVEGELHRIEAQLQDVRHELDRLKKVMIGRERSEFLNARDISILRDGCDWSMGIADFDTVDGVEMLWHSFRDAGDSSSDDDEDDQLLGVELELLREFNAADAFAR